MIEHADGSVTLTKQEYTELSEDREFLYALQAVGVDNWDGYDVAIEMLEKVEDDDEG